MSEDQRVILLRHIRPVHLLTSILLYVLGTGFARYLGESLNFSIFFLGLIWLVFLQVGFYFLGDHFQAPFDIGLYNRMTIEKDEPETKKYQPGDVLLFISFSFLSAAAVITILLGLQGVIDLAVAILMFLFFIGFVLLVVPGFAFDQYGIGEIVTSVSLVLIPPAIAFILQFDSLHRYLVFGVFPLFPLHLAMIILFRLMSYRKDLWLKRNTILVRIGWKQGVFLHNLLIFSGFILFGIALTFGFSIRLAGLVFLTLPFAVYLVWYLTQLETGAPTRWLLITTLSLVVFFLPVYMLTFSSWIG